MAEYKTMRVPESAWEAAQEDRQARGMKWGEWMEKAAQGELSDTTEAETGENIVGRIDDLQTHVDRRFDELQQ